MADELSQLKMRNALLAAELERLRDELARTEKALSYYACGHRERALRVLRVISLPPEETKV